MWTLRQTVARGAILVAFLMAAVLGAAWASGLLSLTAAGSSAGTEPCVAAVFPEAYYQAIAELNACTGSGVAVETAPMDIPWAVGQMPQWPDSRVIVDP